MDVKRLVSEILEDAVFQREPKPYSNVYFIKVLNPGDRRSLFVSFRWKSSKKEVFICTVEVNLEMADKNTRVYIAFLKVKERESITFFKRTTGIPNKTVSDIIKHSVAPLIAEKLNKIEESYNVSN